MANPKGQMTELMALNDRRVMEPGRKGGKALSSGSESDMAQAGATREGDNGGR
jgi:hypothetical protein